MPVLKDVGIELSGEPEVLEIYTFSGANARTFRTVDREGLQNDLEPFECPRMREVPPVPTTG
jgi:hypothetical protein